MSIQELYYDKFLRFVVSRYEKTIKEVKPGHRMKITGLSLDKLQRIIAPLRKINPSVKTFILSDSLSGDDYVHASKLIELRNESPDAILALIPSDSSTSAEDSYGAAFQELSVSDLQKEFFAFLLSKIPQDKSHLFQIFYNAFAEFKLFASDDLSNLVNYLLFVDAENYSLESWGDGLQFMGMIPDSDLAKNEQDLKRYFKLNFEMCTSLLCDFSLTELDRVNKLPLSPDSIQNEVIDFLTKEKDVRDSIELCKRIYEKYPKLNFSRWKSYLTVAVNKKNVKVYADLTPGKKDGEELIKDPSGNLVLNIKDGKKKGKISFTVIVDPAPAQNPDIMAFEICLIRREDFTLVDTLKKAKLGANRKSAKRKMSVNIENEAYESGDYMLRVNAIDENDVVLNVDNDFKDEEKQSKWEEEKAENPEKSKEQFRLDNQAAYCNETVVFTINNAVSSDELEESEEVEKRAKVNTFLQGFIRQRVSLLVSDKEIELDEYDEPKNGWQHGSLNDIFQFDLSSKFAFQIQLPKKLIALETSFLKNRDTFGYINATVGANITDVNLQSLRFSALSQDKIPVELKKLRSELFEVISQSAKEDSGLLETFDIANNQDLIINYLAEYNSWLADLSAQNLSESDSVAVQFIDMVKLEVELPNGTYTDVCLISPLHPLRLGWMVNLWGLFQNWENSTKEFDAYRKSWTKKLDQLFYGKLKMDVAPLILADEKLQDPYQYIGEITFGWGIYSRPAISKDKSLSSDARQIKAYTSSLLNISSDKIIDSDVSAELVEKYINRFAKSHPYAKKLVLNLFNAGDAISFVNALKSIELKNSALTYEIRIFSESNLIKSGSALRELINPESNVAEGAEAFSQASRNRLFPKIRFSLNDTQQFIQDPNHYQAHISFLINPFQIQSSLVRPNKLDRSFYLNSLICRSVIAYEENGGDSTWYRYISEKILPNPVEEFANTEVDLLKNIQNLVGKIMSNTIDSSLPTTTLVLKESDRVLLNLVHDVSDWVVTFDKNMGPEFFDLPASSGENQKIPYLLDYIPGQESAGTSAFLTSKPTSEIEGLMKPMFSEYGIDLSGNEQFLELLEDVRTVSSSLIMQAGTTRNKAFEVLGTTLTKRFLKKKGLLNEAFIIPIDLHQELFADLDTGDRERADNLLVNIDVESKEIVFTVVEIKCRKSLSESEENDLKCKIQAQLINTVSALQQRFGKPLDGSPERLDRELQILELVDLLSFYIKRSQRYAQLDPIVAEEYLVFLSELEKLDYNLKFKQIGVIYNFSQHERQKKCFEGDSCIFTMGESVISEILGDNATLNTERLKQLDNDKDFCNAFEPNRKESIVRIRTLRDGGVLPEERQEEPESDDVENADRKDVNASTAVTEVPADFIPKETESATLEEEPIQPETPSKETQEKTTSESKPVVDNSPKDERSSDVKVLENVDSVFVPPVYDVLIGKTDAETPQYGIIGKTVDNKRLIGIDLNECNTVSLFGVQGAGKSYTIGTVAEMTLKQFSKVNKLPAPLASVIFHYSESMDYAPEFTSMVYPNDDERQLARLKQEYGAEAGSVKDVLLLTPNSQVEKRKSEYPDIEIAPIGFAASELNVADWMFLLGAIGNESTYVKELKQIMKACRYDMTLTNIRMGVNQNAFLSNSQKNLALQKLKFAEDYILNDCSLKKYMRPGRLIIVDLRDEFIEKNEALGLFVVMLNIFASVKDIDGKQFNKFIVFDEAHKYMNDKDLVGSITTAIREMRHKGVSIMIASQDPMSLPSEIIELSSIVIMHKFSSPAWVKHVQKAITALQTLTPMAMSSLTSGEAFLWANKATDRMFTQRPVKISIRPRVTKHGGDTINAVK
ncbi:hypothetical protein B7990_08230 [Fibrobacter sp. UWB4]|uniref:ATP-binding protein n=1 Tax=Fibrobacter sp. UWB4 TaxID=1964356 RepID=UPI000B524E59|nr:DUF853 family protein [Fibrobacter sp. UWB4]OWV17912.1 hypothetical protein B7990_08230 [Fibrobacter sp. UWB4]